MNPNTSPQPNPEQNPSRMRDLVDRAANMVLSLQIAKAEVMERRAGSRMERMDHKIALYQDLGNLALTGQRTESLTASGEPAMPRTITEVIMDRRADKKSQKLMERKVRQYGEQKIFGKPENQKGIDTMPRIRKRIDIAASALKGTTLASERRMARNKLAATPGIRGKEALKRTERQFNHSYKKTEKIAEKPYSSIWRESRRKAAVKDIKRHHHDAERMRTEKYEAQQRIQERKQARADIKRRKQTQQSALRNLNNLNNQP